MKRWLPWLVAVVLFGAVFGPALATLSTHFLGLEYVDHYGTQWFYWYVSTVLGGDGDFGTSDLMFHPWGKDIFRHTGSNVLDAVLALPFLTVFGQVLGYNLFVLTVLGATGAAFYLTARDLSEDRFACGLATVLYVLSPYILYDLNEGRPTQALMLLPVLFVRYMLRTGWSPSWKNPVAAGIFLALSGYQYWFYAFFGGIIALAHGTWRSLVPAVGAGGRARTLARHALMAGVAMALAAPVAIPLAQQSAADDSEVPGLLAVDDWSIYETEPITVEEMRIGVYVWQPLKRFGGYHMVSDMGDELFSPQALLMPAVGGVIGLFFLLAPGRIGRGTMLAMVGAGASIATGTFMLVGDLAIPNPIYIALADTLGFMRRLWWPGRMAAYLNVLLALAVVQVLTWLGTVLAGRLQVATGLALAAIWGLELRTANVLPFPSWDGTVPAGYRCLADGPEGAIVELPYGWTQAHLYYQTSHGRPMIGGMLENNEVFTPPEILDLIEENSFLDAIRNASRMERDAEPVDAADRQELRDLGYAYIVLQKDAFSAPETDSGMQDNVMRMRIRRLQRGLRKVVGSPVYDDARIAIYAPWGDPTPCDLDGFVPDEEARGPREITAEALGLELADPIEIERIVRRPAFDPDASPVEDEDTGAAEEAAGDDSGAPEAPTGDDTGDDTGGLTPGEAGGVDASPDEVETGVTLQGDDDAPGAVGR